MTVATPGEWQCGVRRLAVANGPNIFSNASCLYFVLYFWLIIAQLALGQFCADS